VDITDLQSDPALDAILEMQQELSRTGNVDEVIHCFLLQARSLLGYEYYVSACTYGLAPGEYRVMDRCLIPDGHFTLEYARKNSHWPDVENVQVVRGGIIGQIVSDAGKQPARPRRVSNLQIDKDKVLGTELAGFRTGLAVPIFENGAIDSWLILFSAGDPASSPTEVRKVVLMCSMLSRFIKQQRLTASVEALNRALHEQIEELGRVQRSLLPGEFPKSAVLSMAASYEPCDAAGGDYYDFREFDDGRIGVIMADVAGHGPGASVIMAVMRTVMGAYRTFDRPADTVVPDVNHVLMHALRRKETFVTAFFVVIDPTNGYISYANCGHNPPRLRRSNGEIESLDDGGFMPLGIMRDMTGDIAEFQLQPGDTMLLYTDGITEAFDPADQQFGVEALDRVLSATDGSPQQIIDAVAAAVQSHAKDRPRDDDQTLLAVRYDGTT